MHIIYHCKIQQYACIAYVNMKLLLFGKLRKNRSQFYGIPDTLNWYVNFVSVRKIFHRFMTLSWVYHQSTKTPEWSIL